ncbi:MAG: PAQR family membrane homeostasis protein TrhA [Flavobacteriaceae bacterium]
MLEHLPLDEKWNVYTHGFGAVMSLLGSVLLFNHLNEVDTTTTLALLIYGFSMVFLFSASAIYHGVLPRQQAFWQKIDHIGIYFLIAGTYTPVTLTILKDSSGLYLLAGVWSIAFIGTLYKIFMIGRFKNFSLFLYLAMGWLVIFDIQNVIALFPEEAFIYLALGGFFYTVGTVFYRWECLYFHHVIWHVFVLAGATAHFQMVVVLVV